MNTATFLRRTPLLRAFAVALLMTTAAPRAATAADSSSTSATPDSRVESRIESLHTMLKITPDQESKWKDVSAVMRDNAAQIRPLIDARKSKAASATAVDDLKSYGEIAEVHADGVKKFATAFEPLYDNFSDEQKKTADAMFRKGPGGKHHHSKAAAATPAAP